MFKTSCDDDFYPNTQMKYQRFFCSFARWISKLPPPSHVREDAVLYEHNHFPLCVSEDVYFILFYFICGKKIYKYCVSHHCDISFVISVLATRWHERIKHMTWVRLICAALLWSSGHCLYFQLSVWNVLAFIVKHMTWSGCVLSAWLSQTRFSLLDAFIKRLGSEFIARVQTLFLQGKWFYWFISYVFSTKRTERLLSSFYTHKQKKHTSWWWSYPQAIVEHILIFLWF